MCMGRLANARWEQWACCSQGGRPNTEREALAGAPGGGHSWLQHHTAQSSSSHGKPRGWARQVPLALHGGGGAARRGREARPLSYAQAPQTPRCAAQLVESCTMLAMSLKSSKQVLLADSETTHAEGTRLLASPVDSRGARHGHSQAPGSTHSALLTPTWSPTAAGFLAPGTGPTPATH